MDNEAFVQKVKLLCLQKGIKPTNACKEAGVGGSFLSDMNRGQTPSVAKVQMLAAYLETTTSELLGENIMPATESGDGPMRNVIKIAGRDGSLIERELTDAQLSLMQNMLDQLKPVDDEKI